LGSLEPLIRLDAVTKRFGAVTAVESLSLEIAPGEFFALLGPSGCGKTTLMRLIAGFDLPQQGRILIGGADMAKVPPYLRPVNMMFQSYALFPHMSVEKNIAFGLVQEGLPRRQIAARVAEMLRLVQLESYGARKPHQLSGGQKQRVALARALARRPQLLLLDEPLAALDRKLREETQFELIRVQRELGTTFILVTHDQDEAMVMAQRIAVMREGRIEQIGTPRDIYLAPASRFVAGFIGDINILEAKVEQSDERRVQLRHRSGEVLEAVTAEPLERGREVALAVRPEWVRLSPTPLALANQLIGEVVDEAYVGDMMHWRVRLDSGEIMRASQSNGVPNTAASPLRGARVYLAFPADAGRVLLR
jgi:putrescine transport system ATP-binding protein